MCQSVKRSSAENWALILLSIRRSLPNSEKASHGHTDCHEISAPPAAKPDRVATLLTLLPVRSDSPDDSSQPGGLPLHAHSRGPVPHSVRVAHSLRSFTPGAGKGGMVMSDQKPDLGPRAEMLARLRAVTEEVRKLRREFQASVRTRKSRAQGSAGDEPNPRKKRP